MMQYWNISTLQRKCKAHFGAGKPIDFYLAEYLSSIALAGRGRPPGVAGWIAELGRRSPLRRGIHAEETG